MKRRFLVLAGGLTSEQQSAFSKYVSEKGFNWWHWIDNAWLLISTSGAEDLKDVLTAKTRELASSTNRWVVMELQDDLDWTTGTAQNQKGRSMADWLRDSWNGE